MHQDATGYVCLLIQPTRKEDAGWYTVSAKNEAGIVSCTSRLDIYGKHSITHINTHIFMSLCSHCVHMLSLVLCCCSAAHKLAFSLRPCDKTEAVTPPTGLPPINYAPLIYTHTHTHTQWPPQSQSYYCWGPLIGPCVTLGPLCLIRCYNQTTKGL